MASLPGFSPSNVKRAIRVHSLGHWREKNKSERKSEFKNESLRTLIEFIHFYKNIKKKIANPNALGAKDDDIEWTVRNVSFSLDQGSVLCVHGNNSAGIASFTGMIAGALRPCEGEIDCTGRVVSLFNPSIVQVPTISARENLFLLANFLGLSGSLLAKRMDDIIEFAACERWIDESARRIPKGIFLDIATAMVLHLDPDIVVMGAVCPKSSAAFRKNVLRKMVECAKAGSIIIYVCDDEEESRHYSSHFLRLYKQNDVESAEIFENPDFSFETAMLYLAATSADTISDNVYVMDNLNVSDDDDDDDDDDDILLDDDGVTLEKSLAQSEAAPSLSSLERRSEEVFGVLMKNPYAANEKTLKVESPHCKIVNVQILSPALEKCPRHHVGGVLVDAEDGAVVEISLETLKPNLTIVSGVDLYKSKAFIGRSCSKESYKIAEPGLVYFHVRIPPNFLNYSVLKLKAFVSIWDMDKSVNSFIMYDDVESIRAKVSEYEEIADHPLISQLNTGSVYTNFSWDRIEEEDLVSKDSEWTP